MNNIKNDYSIVANYGLIGNSIIDVTEELLTHCTIENNKLIINQSLSFNNLKYDPCLGIQKMLYITYKNNYNKLTELVINEYRDTDVVLSLCLKNKSSNQYEKDKHDYNIIIYPHCSYSEDNGGLNVMYYLAKVLSENNKNVRIYPTNGFIENNIFNNYYKQNEFNIKKSVVIYCEGTVGNPLNAIYVVRWLLSEIGKNVPVNRINSFGKNELVYYFNTEHKIENQPLLKNNVYKFLSLIYLNPIYTNYKWSYRDGWCFTKRKISYHNNVVKIHPNDAYEFTGETVHKCIDFCNIFNKYKYFVSYDPLTWHTFNAAICGCISIVHPINGMNKSDWMNTTTLTEYFKSHKDEKLYGIAYGIEELEWATNTIHLAHEQINKIVNFFKETHIPLFINDLNYIIEGKKLNNTIQEIFFN